jgi:deoxyribonuclease IV
MLIGAHVSPAGGLPNAIKRGVEQGCTVIQIFNQSPRQWKPTAYRDEDVSAFRKAMAASTIDGVLIHAVYLLNCASEDADIRAKSLESLTNSLRVGQEIGARCVVLHPGSAKTGSVPAAIARAGETVREALADSDGCPLHLENTAGAGGTLGRSIDELEALLEACGGAERLGLCLDSCHLFASGASTLDSPAAVDELSAEIDRKIGLERVGSLHLNDSQAPYGSNVDRHANIGKGEIGADGCAAFLAAPAFADLPCVLETPGKDGNGPGKAELARARALRKRGVVERS